MPLLKILNVSKIRLRLEFARRLVASERTGMSVVSHNGDVFAPQKLASRSVHGCTLLDRLFSKGLRKNAVQKASALLILQLCGTATLYDGNLVDVFACFLLLYTEHRYVIR